MRRQLISRFSHEKREKQFDKSYVVLVSIIFYFSNMSTQKTLLSVLQAKQSLNCMDILIFSFDKSNL